MRRIEFTAGFAVYLLALFYLIPAKILMVFFLAAGLHELAHIAAICACRCRVEQLIFGAADVQILHGVLSSAEEALCAAAGPAVNLLCAGIFLRSMPEFALASLILGGFNLLPIRPLDGGRVLCALLQLHLPTERAESIACFIGYGCCGLIFAASLFAFYHLRLGLWPIVVAAALPIRLWMMEKAVAFPMNQG